MSCMHVTVELKGAKGKYNGIPFVVGIRTVLSSYRHLSIKELYLSLVKVADTAL